MKWTLKALSPLHVGRDRLESSEFTSFGNAVYLLDEQRLAQWLGRSGLVDDFVLRSLDRDPPTVSKYMMEKRRFNEKTLGEMSSRSILCLGNAPKTHMLEHVTDPLTKQPLIPGSSIKGAIRNALMARASSNDPAIPEAVKAAVDDPRARKSTVGELLDNRLMRGRLMGAKSGPNRDWMRCLVVGDAHPIGDGAKVTEVVEVKVICLSDRGGSKSYAKAYSIWVEAIRPQSRFEVDISVDELLLKKIEGKPPFRDVSNLLDLLKAQAEKLASEDTEFYSGAELQDPQRALDSIKEEANLRLGWGAGWLSTSVGSAMDKQIRRQIGAKFYRHWGSLPFPRHRRLTVDKFGRAHASFGWASLQPSEAAGTGS